MGVQDRKQREFLRREQEILDAALALFASDDWQAITIGQIAERAEVAKGTIYLHFETKEEIYARLTLGVHRRILARLEQLPTTGAPLDRLAAAARVFWDAHTGLALEFRRVVQYCERDDLMARLPERTRNEMVAVGGRMSQIIFEIVGAGVEAGVLPAEPLPLLLFKAQSALFGAIRQAWAGCVPAGGADEYRDAIIAFLIAGLSAGSATVLAEATH